MPEQNHYKYHHCGEMGGFEELVAEKLPKTESARHFNRPYETKCAHRMELWDAKVSQAWHMMATMPVQ